VVYDVTGWIFAGTGESRAPSVQEHSEFFARAARYAAQLALEFQFETCDVFDLSVTSFNTAKYQAAVKKADVYYCDVGNTWALLYYLRERGAATDADGVAARVKRGELLYVGNSAGGIVAGRSVDPAKWKNWDDQWGWQNALPASARVDWNYPEACRGLDIAGGASFFPHYEVKYMKVCQERSQELDHQVVCCANGHGVVIEGGVTRLVSPEGVPPHIPMVA